MKLALIYERSIHMGRYHDAIARYMMPLRAMLFSPFLPQLVQFLVLLNCILVILLIGYAIFAVRSTEGWSLIERRDVSPFFNPILVAKNLCPSLDDPAIDFIASFILTVDVSSWLQHIVNIANFKPVLNSINVKRLMAQFRIEFHNAHDLNLVDHLVELIAQYIFRRHEEISDCFGPFQSAFSIDPQNF